MCRPRLAKPQTAGQSLFHLCMEMRFLGEQIFTDWYFREVFTLLGRLCAHGTWELTRLGNLVSKGGSKNGNSGLIHFTKWLWMAASRWHLNHQLSTQHLLCSSGCIEDKGELRQSPGLWKINRSSSSRFGSIPLILAFGMWRQKSGVKVILSCIKGSLECMRPCLTERQGEGKAGHTWVWDSSQSPMVRYQIGCVDVRYRSLWQLG